MWKNKFIVSDFWCLTWGATYTRGVLRYFVQHHRQPELSEEVLQISEPKFEMVDCEISHGCLLFSFFLCRNKQHLVKSVFDHIHCACIFSGVFPISVPFCHFWHFQIPQITARSFLFYFWRQKFHLCVHRRIPNSFKNMSKFVCFALV